MEFGKTFKVWLYISGHKESHSWFVACINCGHLEQGVGGQTRAGFCAYLKRKGWFQNRKGKWTCGSHGRRGEERVENWEWRLV